MYSYTHACHAVGATTGQLAARSAVIYSYTHAYHAMRSGVALGSYCVRYHKSGIGNDNLAV